jgi:hypothetical protein
MVQPMNQVEFEYATCGEQICDDLRSVHVKLHEFRKHRC